MEKHDHSHDHKHSHDHHPHSHSDLASLRHQVNQRKTMNVVVIAAVTMIVEISFGYYTNSMALLADGWHMGSHVLALGLAWVAYALVRRWSQLDGYKHCTDKALALSGYTSAIILLVMAVIMAIESVNRLLHPLHIIFDQALLVAVIGLLVNAVSAVLLHQKDEHHDHNSRAAYLHVVADALTSVVAILALLAGRYFQWYSLDALSGLLSSVLIAKWSIELVFNSGKALLDLK